MGSLSTTGTSAAVTTPLMSVASIMTPDNQSHPSGANYGSGATGTVVADPGIPAIKKWLADRILTGECIDLAELLPAKGRSKNLSGSLEGQVVLMHSANYFQAKQLIPDLANAVAPSTQQPMLQLGIITLSFV